MLHGPVTTTMLNPVSVLGAERDRAKGIWPEPPRQPVRPAAVLILSGIWLGCHDATAELWPWLDEIASTVGADWGTYRREGPGMSAFALEDGAVYHTYSAYERGFDVLWGMYQWLDRAPRGRNETSFWYRRHDEYGNA